MKALGRKLFQEKKLLLSLMSSTGACCPTCFSVYFSWTGLLKTYGETLCIAGGDLIIVNATCEDEEHDDESVSRACLVLRSICVRE